MTAQIGAEGLNLPGDPLPELMTSVAGIQPRPAGDWVNLKDQLGFRSIQRLVITDVDDSVVVATWPAEFIEQARYLYGGGRGSPLVAAAIERGWTVEPSPHIAYFRAAPSRRLYMRPPIAPLDYAALWESQDGLHQVRSHTWEDVEHELWPWLKQRGLADDGDDTVLWRFLDGRTDALPAHMRPGLRLRRVWSAAEVAELGSALPEAIRLDFDAVFVVAGEPSLSSAEITGTDRRKGGSPERTGTQAVGPGLGAPYRRVGATELSGGQDSFSVDPALVERGLRGHADTQNELACVLSNAGIEPRRGLLPGPNFDLAWQKEGIVFVAEVKSITAENEEHQLRLGLGQVLRYRQHLSALGHERVVAVLVPEHQPSDPCWRELCQELGVVLLCRNEFERAPAMGMP